MKKKQRFWNFRLVLLNPKRGGGGVDDGSGWVEADLFGFVFFQKEKEDKK